MVSLFGDYNYTLTRESPETRGEFENSAPGSVTAGWEILSPPAGPDGIPYQLIFVGLEDAAAGGVHQLDHAVGVQHDDAREDCVEYTAEVARHG